MPVMVTGSPSFCAKPTISACAPDFQTSSPTMTMGRLASTSRRAASLDGGGIGPDARPEQEALGGQDLGLDAFGFERVVRHGEVNGSAGIGGRDLESAPQQQRQAFGAAGLPADLGELARDFLLVVAGARGRAGRRRSRVRCR